MRHKGLLIAFIIFFLVLLGTVGFFAYACYVKAVYFANPIIYFNKHYYLIDYLNVRKFIKEYSLNGQLPSKIWLWQEGGDTYKQYQYLYKPIMIKFDVKGEGKGILGSKISDSEYATTLSVLEKPGKLYHTLIIYLNSQYLSSFTGDDLNHALASILDWMIKGDDYGNTWFKYPKYDEFLNKSPLVRKIL